MEEGSIEEGVVKMLSSSEEKDTTRASSAAVILEVCMCLLCISVCNAVEHSCNEHLYNKFLDITKQ